MAQSLPVWGSGLKDPSYCHHGLFSLLPSRKSEERVYTFRFLGVLNSANLSRTDNIAAVIKKTYEQLHFLRVLSKHKLNSKLLLTFYHSSIESLLTYCIPVWYGSCTVGDRMRHQRGISL
ncbi:hypothetical protein CCH79_00020013 [Gambusia affinis]|uniref:Alkylated DNA repair protein AlkB homologue 8 N-terminal domain-containing protein n=1 Tax=Gambusia affinis TaxID=33528 RepID=A0A315VRX2_GAMAF|nr:hypothetical protein CCH79_00020013 [Gambusia affinis]